MPTEDTTTSPSGLDVTKLFSELEIPFSPDQVRWRVTNTTNDKKRGQIVPYADSRAYIDRLNLLFTPQGWTREYKVETMTNMTRVKKGESIVSGKVLVTCTVTIFGIGSHSGTGEEWADDDNGMTSADAQAFKRACSCFGLGRYFYDIQAIWVDLDQNRQPVRTPALFAWALPENWRKGMRPSGRNGNGSAAAPSNRTNGRSQANGSNSPKLSGNGHTTAGNVCKTDGDDFDARILSMEKTVGTLLYRNILREYGRVNQPRLIRDPAIKRTVLQMLESAIRGIERLEAVTRRLDAKTVVALLAKLQAPPLGQISDMKTLQHVVFGLEELAGSDQHHAA
ncbi:MAG: Rad52/Rad22 family DNA repair protein [Candidatus Korobacteraceae bacterium]